MNLVIVFTCLLAAAAASPVQHRASCGRIVGGQEAVPHSAPYIISIRIGNTHACGGVLVTNSRIISAGHCFLDTAIRVAVAGDHDIGTPDFLVQQQRVIINPHVHPDYAGGVGPNDIAVASVLLPFILNAYVNVIALPADGVIPAGGSNSTLYGWGSISVTCFPEYPYRLQVANMPILPIAQCRVEVGGQNSDLLADSNLCTGPIDQTIQACSGDSGGPLVQENDGVLSVIGLVSWGPLPCGNGPSVFTRVSAFIDFIQQYL